MNKILLYLSLLMPLLSFGQEWTGSSIKTTNPDSYPYGININTTYPSGWAREFSFSRNGSGKLFSFGAYGIGNTLVRGYIGGNSTSQSVYSSPWMSFLPNGNIGIGIISPAVKLEVSGTVQGSHMGRFKGWTTGGETGLGFEIGTSNGEGYTYVYDRTNSSYGTMHIQNVIHTSGNNGNVGIGISNPAVKLDVSGSIQGSHMGRFKGWTTGGETGLGFEIGTSNGEGYTYVYDRTNSSYGTMHIQNVIHTSGNNGYVGIGTETPDSKLTVAGKIHSREVKVTIDAGADFVFNESYELRTLEETEQFISENKHLPEIASENEMLENGVEIGKLNIKLLQKIEELTLYMINMNKRMGQLEEENGELKKEISTLKKE